MLYLYQPAERLRIFGYGEGRHNVARAGDAVELTDDEATFILGSVKGEDGGPALILIEHEQAKSEQAPPKAEEKPKRRRGRPRKSESVK